MRGYYGNQARVGADWATDHDLIVLQDQQSAINYRINQLEQRARNARNSLAALALGVLGLTVGVLSNAWRK
jgi:hypothetical protein